MATLCGFRTDDQRILDDMLEIRSRQTGCTDTLAELVAEWYDCVHQLQRERWGQWAAYESGLAVRAALAEIEECLSIPGRQMLLAALLDADRRFLALSEPKHTSLKCPWWQRIPRAWARTAHHGPEASQSASAT